MSTYATLKAQIAKLQTEAQEARDKEVSQVVARIRSDMAEYGLSPADLGFSGKGRKATKTSAPKSGAPRYRDPASGKTWTGHGKPPNWIAGKDRATFLIEAASPAAAPAPAAKASKAKKSTAKQPGTPKYRDPASGKTWTGNGKPPAWLAGKDRTAFLIEGAAPAAAPAPARKGMNEAVKAAVATRANGASKRGPKAKTKVKAKAPRGAKAPAGKTAAAATTAS